MFRLLSPLLAAVLALAPLPSRAAEPVRPLIEHVQQHRDGKAAWSINFAALANDRSGLPIGVFDSGIGGLTVMEAILSLDAFNNDTLRPGADGRPDFAGERFIYFGDQANMPYGNYPSKGHEDYLRELILKDAVFLLGTRARFGAAAAPHFDKPPVKALVIACNTATAYGLEDIRVALREWKIDAPVIGVIEAGARATAAALPDDGRPHAVGVMATVGTCASGAYPKAIGKATGQAGKSPPSVTQQGCAQLAAAIESGNRDEIVGQVKAEVDALVRQQPAGTPLGAVVLGCTHFPLALAELKGAFLAHGLEKVRFIDPADSTARELFRELARARLRNKGGASVPAAQFFFSVPNPGASLSLTSEGALSADYKTGRTIGRFDVEDTVAIPLTADTLPSGTAGLVQSLPAVWQQMQGASKGGPQSGR